MLYKHVSGEPAPPPSVSVDADGLSLVATWSEPFSLKGEQLSYVVSITNTATRAQEEVNVSTTRFVLSEPIGERDCAEYQFTVFSRNSISRSQIGVTERIHIPTSNWCEVYACYVHASVCVWTTVYCGLCLSLFGHSFGNFLFFIFVYNSRSCSELNCLNCSVLFLIWGLCKMARSDLILVFSFNLIAGKICLLFVVWGAFIQIGPF